MHVRILCGKHVSSYYLSTQMEGNVPGHSAGQRNAYRFRSRYSLNDVHRGFEEGLLQLGMIRKAVACTSAVTGKD